MRLADYVIAWLRGAGVDRVFTVCGGGSIFLNDAVRKADLAYTACHHEQGAAFAAEAYARIRGQPAVCMVTSGPGGTNALTGVAGCWTDHVPVIFISGQSFLSQTVRKRPFLRTCGVQEISIVQMARPVTKYTAMVEEPESILAQLQTAWHMAKNGRPGPTWLDIPADIQNAKIISETLEPASQEIRNPEELPRPTDACAGLLFLLKQAKRPLLHVGQGVRIAGAIEKMFAFAERARIPIVTARNGNDLIASDHPLFVGRPGTFAQRAANFAVQSADLYIAVGTRLSLAQTGYNAPDYARRAKIVMVDMDKPELDKATFRPYMSVHADALAFFEVMDAISRGDRLPDWSAWLARCQELRRRYPPVTDEMRRPGRYLNSYHLIDLLSDALSPADVVVTDMGFAFQNTHQAFRVKSGQRLMTNGGLAPMGWGLPAAIGAAQASGRRTICIAGDGGLMMNLQELATLAYQQLPVKLFVLNNGGYLTMRQSQENAFDGYMGSDEASGLSFPHFGELASAFRMPYWRLINGEDAKERLGDVLEGSRPAFVEVLMDPRQDTIPKSVNRRDAEGRIVQTPIEDAWPYLPREELDAVARYLEAA